MEIVKPNTPSKEAFETAYRYWCDNDFKSILVIDLDKIEEYNKVPVNWCGSCGSLAVMNCDTPLNEELTCYCGKCNSTSIEKGSIEDWLRIENKQNS